MISRKLTENRIELLELLKKISALAGEVPDLHLKAKIGEVLNEAYLVCLNNAELMSDPQIIKAFYEAEKSLEDKEKEEELELKMQAQEFKAFADTVSPDFLAKWANRQSFEA